MLPPPRSIVRSVLTPHVGVSISALAVRRNSEGAHTAPAEEMIHDAVLSDRSARLG